MADLPPACELAAWYATHLPQEEVYALADRLTAYLDEHPDDPHATKIADFVACIHAIAP